MVSYLYLKEKDVQGKTFSQRRICKFDSTQKHDGPPGCRKLKIHPPTSQKLNGWQNVGGELSYEYENGWKTKVDQICIDSQHMDQIQRHFQAKEEQIKHDYKARIQYLKNYFKEIDENYKIEKSNLPESIKKFRSRYRQSREELKPYMKYKGCKFYEVLPMLRDRSDQQTLVKDFKAFQPLTDLKLKEKAKFLDDLFKHLNKHKRVTQEHSDEDEVEQAEQELADPEQVKLKRAFSQMIHQDVEAAAQEFNQEQYLFEVKDVNSFGQQIRMNKLHSIMDKMFQSHHTFNKDLQGYAYGRLKHQSVGDVSNENLSLMKNVFDSITRIAAGTGEGERNEADEQVTAEYKGEPKPAAAVGAGQHDGLASLVPPPIPQMIFININSESPTRIELMASAGPAEE